MLLYLEIIMICKIYQILAFEIGQDVQAYDEDLDDLADGTLTSSKVQYLENVTSDVQTQLDAKGTGTVSSLSDP